MRLTPAKLEDSNLGLQRCWEREEERGACISPRWWLELVTMANEKDVGVCGVFASSRGFQDPAVLSQHRGIRQVRCHKNEPKWPWHR